MKLYNIFLLVLVFMAAESPSHAEESELCYDPNPVLEISTQLDFRSPPRLDFYLPSRNIYGSYPTKAAAHISFQERLEILFDHILPPNQVGLAYTVHRLRIEVGEIGSESFYFFDRDFTEGCTAPGVSFFPGQSIQLPEEKLPSVPFDQKTVLPVRVQSWGHL